MHFRISESKKTRYMQACTVSHMLSIQLVQLYLICIIQLILTDVHNELLQLPQMQQRVLQLFLGRILLICCNVSHYLRSPDMFHHLA